jgi:hypothetical protein
LRIDNNFAAMLDTITAQRSIILINGSN